MENEESELGIYLDRRPPCSSALMLTSKPSCEEFLWATSPSLAPSPKMHCLQWLELPGWLLTFSKGRPVGAADGRIISQTERIGNH
jgi:hypothetical protein